MTVTIEKLNEAYLRIKCDPAVARELSEFFTLKFQAQSSCPPSDEKYGTAKSDYLALVTAKIYSGLLPYVEEFLEEQGHAYTVSEEFSKRTLDKSTTTKFVQSLSKIKARDYQIDAIHNILESNRGLIVSPTGSGKSFIIYALVRYYVQRVLKVLIVVPTTSLVEQMYTDFADYGWSVEDFLS